MTRRLPIIALAAGMALTAAFAAPAQRPNCSAQLGEVSTEVQAMHEPDLKARAQKRLQAAQEAAEAQHEKRCMRHLKAVRKVLREDAARHRDDS